MAGGDKERGGTGEPCRRQVLFAGTAAPRQHAVGVRERHWHVDGRGDAMLIDRFGQAQQAIEERGQAVAIGGGFGNERPSRATDWARASTSPVRSATRARTSASTRRAVAASLVPNRATSQRDPATAAAAESASVPMTRRPPATTAKSACPRG